MMMGFPFSSKEAVKANKDIFETIYHAALEESCEIAKRDGSARLTVLPQVRVFTVRYVGRRPGAKRYDWRLKERLRRTAAIRCC
jgi:ribonucleoside-diphosphate reductase subunit M1